MRGNIIQWNGEKGIVSASGQRYDFNIHLWQGGVAPKPDMSVTLTLNEGALLGITPIADVDLAKEKLNQISGQGSKIAQGILSDVGIDIAIAYGAFALSALFLNMLAGTGMMAALTAKMAGVLNGMPVDKDAGFSNGGMGFLLVLVAIATIAVPYFWKHKFAPLALCLPLLIVFFADYQTIHIIYTFKHMMDGLSSGMFGNMMSSMTPTFSIGFGAYISTGLAAYLAFRGFIRFKNQ